MEATETRAETERYASETRASADSYAQQTRQAAEEEVAEARRQAEQEAQEVIASAQAQARRIVEEGTQRREDIEAVITDLVRRRNDVLSDTEELSAKLTGAVSEHRPDSGSDPFAAPEELDPLARDGVGDGIEAEEELEAEEEVVEVEQGGSTEETQVVDAESEHEART